MKRLIFNHKKNMKELERFGFEANRYLHGSVIYQTPISLFEDNTGKPCLRIRSYLGDVETYDNFDINNPNIFLLYDLIKADLLIVEDNEDER